MSKSLVLEDHSYKYVVNGPKHCWNLNNRTFIIFIDSCEDKEGWKSFSELYAKS